MQNLMLPSLLDNKWSNTLRMYLSTLLEHLECRFPDVKIIEAFPIFDVRAIPTDPVKRQEYEYGKE